MTDMSAFNHRPRGKVFLIGAGPGDPDLLTLKAVKMLERADVVVHDRLVSEEVLAMAPTSAVRIDVGKAPRRHPVPQSKINELLIQRALAGDTVARLKGGDPFIFGRGSEEALALSAVGVAVEVAPGVTAAQGVAASTGVPLTHRGFATGVRYVTGHCRNDLPLDLDWDGLADADTTLVIYMGAGNIGEISAELQSRGAPPKTLVLAVSNATRAEERHLISTLADIPVDMRRAKLKGPILFIVGPVVSLMRQPLKDAAKRFAPRVESFAGG